MGKISTLRRNLCPLETCLLLFPYPGANHTGVGMRLKITERTAGRDEKAASKGLAPAEGRMSRTYLQQSLAPSRHIGREECT